MIKTMLIFVVLLAAACDSDPVPAEVWCDKYVSCLHDVDTEAVQGWCERQFAPSKAQVSEACLQQVSASTCEDFLDGHHSACGD